MTVAYLDALGVICALGEGRRAVLRGLLDGDTAGIAPQAWPASARALPVGAVRTPLPALPDDDPAYATRNNRLLAACLHQVEPALARALARYGAARIGVVIGTSTTGIAEAGAGIAERLRNGAFPPGYHYRQQELVAPAAALAHWRGLAGPCHGISTACTSGARALLSARRLLDLGLCDAVLCGGVDSLCDLTLQGFSALEATSPERCNPFSRNRRGINIGEAGALFLMTRERLSDGPSIALLGGGASSDAHHISAPEPEGRGALAAMRRALDDAGLAPEQIGYLNLHGTATAHNDAMESRAVHALFPQGVPCSSSKPLVGHTLGAAGALEAAFCWLVLAGDDPRLPPHVWDGQADPTLPALALVAPGQTGPARGARRFMSNSFAFGGNNTSLILGDAS